MKKVININFQGRVVPIEETSYDLLKQYTESLRNYFANEEGRDEIINDIESRISELFQERLKNGATCITDDDINAIINSIGRPQELADADTTGDTSFAGPKIETENREQQQHTFPPTGKRLYRDVNNKILGGVCSGIAAYFNIEPIIVRLVFIFSGIGFLAYLLLWAFVPASDTIYNGVRRRLYRNPDDKIIGGVCSGIASYFNINVWIPRVLFLVPFISFFFRWGHFGPFTFPHFISFTFSPGSFFLYIILWMVIPEASTTSEKLEMKGEKVDLNTISNSVKEEMKGVKERMSRFGKEASQVAQEKGQAVGTEVTYAARKTRSTLGNIIVFLVKAFAYFVIGVVLLSLLIGLFVAAAVVVGYSNIKGFVLAGGWENFYAWGTLLFFICVPIIAIVAWLIRRIAKIRRSSNLMRYSFLALWIFGIFCFVSLLVSLGRDVRSTSNISEENIKLPNPGVQKLEVTATTNNYYNDQWFSFEPFINLDEDTAYVPNVRVRIIKSDTDSFKVYVRRMSNGQSRADANNLAGLIPYNVVQKDSVLTIDRAIPVNTINKFRFQRVVVTIAVPVGKQIKISKGLGWPNMVHFPAPVNDNRWYDEDWDSEVHGWNPGYTYVMHADGLLFTLSGDPADKGAFNRLYNKHLNEEQNFDDGSDEGENNTNNNGGYRYEKTQKAFDSVKKALDQQKLKTLDSLNKVEEKIMQEKQKLQKAQDANTPKQEAYNPPVHNYDFVLNI